MSDARDAAALVAALAEVLEDAGAVVDGTDVESRIDHVDGTLEFEVPEDADVDVDEIGGGSIAIAPNPEALEGELAQRDERIAELEDALDERAAEATELREDRDEQLRIVETLEDELEDVRDERDRLQDRVDDIEATVDEEEIQRLKDELDTARGQQSALREENEELQERVEHLAADVDELEDDLERVREDRDEAANRVDELEGALEEYKAALAETEDDDVSDVMSVDSPCGPKPPGEVPGDTEEARLSGPDAESKPDQADEEQTGPEEDRRKYLNNNELRAEIAYAVGQDPTRFDGGSDATALQKETVTRIAEQLQPEGGDLEVGAMEMSEIYRSVGEWIGVEHSGSKQNWGLNRDHLKAIHEAIGAEDPESVPDVQEESDGQDDAVEDLEQSEDDEPPDVDELTQGQRDIVDAVRELGEATQADVTGAVDLTSGTVANYLRELAKEGVVEIDDESDRRRYRIPAGVDVDGADQEDDADDGALEDYEPTETEAEILDAFEELGESFQFQVAEAVGRSEDTLLDHLSNLREEGVVKSRTHPDSGRFKLYRRADQEPADDVDDPPPKDAPAQCGDCGRSFDGTLERNVHRVEEHGHFLAEHPLGPGEFQETVADADGLEDIADATGFSSEKVLRLLGIYGLEDVVGPDGIEIADVTDVAYETVDDGQEDDVDEDDAPAVDGDADREESEAARIAAEHDLDRGAIADAIADAQAPLHVHRDLGIDRETAQALCEALDVYDYERGTVSVPSGDAFEIVSKHVPPTAVADGGESGA